MCGSASDCGLVNVRVFLSRLDYVVVVEQAAFPFAELWQSMSGSATLWLGISWLSIVEFLVNRVLKRLKHIFFPKASQSHPSKGGVSLP